MKNTHRNCFFSLFLLELQFVDFLSIWHVHRCIFLHLIVAGAVVRARETHRKTMKQHFTENHSTGRLMSETSVNTSKCDAFISRCSDEWRFFWCGKFVEISNYDIFILQMDKKIHIFPIELNRNTHEMRT